MSLARWPVVICSLWLGCTASPRGLDWELTIPDDNVEARAVALEATILDGDCSSTRVLHRSMTRLTDTAPAPPPLSPGSRAFQARLFDADCVMIAEGCIQVGLPLEDGAAVVVRLDSLAGRSAACPADTCDDGICSADTTDGGPARDSDIPDDSSTAADSAPADAAPDSGPLDSGAPMDTAPPCTPGLCQVCGPTGPQTPIDDEACGTIDCDGLDRYSVEGSASATGTNYRRLRDYEDVTVNRCASLGACKAPNTAATCTVVTESRVNSCGTCERATESGCSDYAVGTGCGTDSRCYSGVCATACSTGNNGSVSCSTLCAWCSGTCHGAVTRSGGSEVGCGDTGLSTDCYCTY